MEDITTGTIDMSLIYPIGDDISKSVRTAYLCFVRGRTQPKGGRIWDICRLQQIIYTVYILYSAIRKGATRCPVVIRHLCSTFILTRQELRVIRFRWAPIVYPLERYILTIEL